MERDEQREESTEEGGEQPTEGEPSGVDVEAPNESAPGHFDEEDATSGDAA